MRYLHNNCCLPLGFTLRFQSIGSGAVLPLLRHVFILLNDSALDKLKRVIIEDSRSP